MFGPKFREPVAVDIDLPRLCFYALSLLHGILSLSSICLIFHLLRRGYLIINGCREGFLGSLIFASGACCFYFTGCG